MGVYLDPLILLVCSVVAIRYLDAPIEWIRAVPVIYVLLRRSRAAPRDIGKAR